MKSDAMELSEKVRYWMELRYWGGPGRTPPEVGPHRAPGDNRLSEVLIRRLKIHHSNLSSQPLSILPIISHYELQGGRPLNEHRLTHGNKTYGSCIILLLLILALAPPATAAADTMFRADPQHTGVF
jgi:hypothetical protein